MFYFYFIHMITRLECFSTGRLSGSKIIGTLRRQAGALKTSSCCVLGQREDPVHKGDAGGAAPGRRHQAPSREGRGHHPGSWLHHIQGTSSDISKSMNIL